MKKINFSGIKKQSTIVKENINNYTTKANKGLSSAFNKKILGNVPLLNLPLKSDDSYVTIKFVPYFVDKTHPLVVEGKLNPDDVAFTFQYDHHYLENSKTVAICPASITGSRCPICEKQYNLRNEGDTEGATKIAAKRRVLYNVYVCKDTINKEPIKGLAVLSESQYLFEQELIKKMDSYAAEHESIGFSIDNLVIGATDQKNSYCLKIKPSPKKSGGKFNKEYVFAIVKDSWNLNDTYAEDTTELKTLLEDALPLHKLITIRDDKELTELLNQNNEEDEDQDEEDSVNHDDEEEKPSRSRRNHDEEDDDEEEEEKPSRSRRSRDDEDDDEEEEKPTRSRRSRAIDEDDSDRPNKDYDEEEEEDIKRFRSRRNRG